MTLHPGDLVFTGAPGQVGPVRPGDRVEVEVDGIGELANPVVAEPPPGAARDVAAGLDRPGHRPGHEREP